MKKSLVITIILLMGVVWAAADLASKRWVQLHLATPVHLLPVTAADGETVCKALQHKLGIKSCRGMNNSIYQVEGPLKLTATTPLKQVLVDHPLLFAWLKDKGFAVRLRTWQEKGKARVDTVGQALKVSLHGHVKDIKKVLEHEIYGMPRGKGSVVPGKVMEKGDVYLLASRRIVLIPGLLDLSYVENPAGAWGILHNIAPSTRKWVFYVFSFIALLVIIYLIVFPPSHSWWIIFALGGILGGAIGNLVDRMSSGAVVDFIHMFWGRFNWPNYNVADIGITVGLVILLIHSFFAKPTHPKS